MVLAALPLGSAQGEEQFNLLQRHWLAGVAPVSGTEPAPQLHLNSGVDAGLFTIVLGLAHGTHSSLVRLNLQKRWLTEAYGQG